MRSYFITRITNFNDDLMIKSDPRHRLHIIPIDLFRYTVEPYDFIKTYLLCNQVCS